MGWSIGWFKSMFQAGVGGQRAEDAPPQGITQYDRNAVWESRIVLYSGTHFKTINPDNDDDELIVRIIRVLNSLESTHKRKELSYGTFTRYYADRAWFTIGKIKYLADKNQSLLTGYTLEYITVDGTEINPSTPGIWWDIAKQQLARETPRLEKLLHDLNHQTDEESKRKLKEIEKHLLS